MVRRAVALLTLMFSIYSGARLMGLDDMGRKVDLMERSIRRGEGGQAELAEKMEQEERGEYPGAYWIELSSVTPSPDCVARCGD